MPETYSSPEEILRNFSDGKFVIVMCEDKEQEGDFFVLAEHISAEKINFLLTHAKGMICVACSKEILDHFQIPPMVENAEDHFGTNFTISVDAKAGITTGVSAQDRATTISVLAKSQEFFVKDLVRPGHTHPLCAKDPKDRWGHTECSVEMAKKAGKTPAVVICEILNKEGEKATKAELFQMANKWKMPITSTNEMKKFLGFAQKN